MPGSSSKGCGAWSLPRSTSHAFGSLIDELLEQSSLQRRGAFLALPTHLQRWARTSACAGSESDPLLEDRKFDPPRVRDIARDTGIPEVEVRHLLKTVARTGDVAQVAHDHFFLTTAVAELADIAGNVAERNGATRAAEFRIRLRPAASLHSDSRILRPGRLPAQSARRSPGQTGKSMAMIKRSSCTRPFGSHVHSSRLVRRAPSGAAARPRAVQKQAKTLEECRVPVGRPDFKSGRGCQQS